jgi:hypothetical protein
VVVMGNTPSEGFDAITLTIPSAGSVNFFTRLKLSSQGQFVENGQVPVVVFMVAGIFLLMRKASF